MFFHQLWSLLGSILGGLRSLNWYFWRTTTRPFCWSIFGSIFDLWSQLGVPYGSQIDRKWSLKSTMRGPWRPKMPQEGSGASQTPPKRPPGPSQEGPGTISERFLIDFWSFFDRCLIDLILFFYDFLNMFCEFPVLPLIIFNTYCQPYISNV